MEGDYLIRPGERQASYACRLLGIFTKHSTFPPEEYFPLVRSIMATYNTLMKDDVVWFREIAPHLYEYTMYKQNSHNPRFQFSAKAVNLTTSRTSGSSAEPATSRSQHKRRKRRTRVVDVVTIDEKMKLGQVVRCKNEKDYLEVKKLYMRLQKFAHKKRSADDNLLCDKVRMIYGHIHEIERVAVNEYSMTKSLLHYVFPNLFNDDKHHLFYRCSKVHGLGVLSSKKLNLIRVILENRFKIDKRKWTMLKKYIDVVCGTGKPPVKLGTYPYYKLKSVDAIVTRYQGNDVDELKTFVLSSFSLVDLTEKLTKAMFPDIVKGGEGHTYRCYPDGTHQGLDPESVIDLCYKVRVSTDNESVVDVHNAIVETVNRYLIRSEKKVGDNVDACIIMAKTIN
ncbi:m31R [Myxoma virus]|nr:m31R [Myxoma virus]